MSRESGWGWPLNARKAHYWSGDDNVSVCGRWLFTGTRDDSPLGTKPGKDDCPTCWKKAAKLQQAKP